MKLFKTWKKWTVAVLAACAVAFSVLAVGLISSASGDDVVAVGETTNVTVDFSSATDVSKFAVANSDGRVGTIVDGKYYPNGWAQNYMNVAIPTDSVRHVTVDFYLPSIEDTGSSYSQLWIGLITDAKDINGTGKSLAMRMNTGNNVTYMYKNAQKTTTYVGQFSKMTFGATHRLEMYIDHGVITYAMDGNVIAFTEGFTTVSAPSNGVDSNAYLFFEYSSNKGYIDNVTISDCTELDFSSNLVASKLINTTTGGGKGTAEDGVFKPAAWGRNYWVNPIDLTENVVLSYDFYMPSHTVLGTADKYSQFFAALVSDLDDINGNDQNDNAKSISFRLYDNGNTTPVNTSYSVWPTAQSPNVSSNLAWMEDVSYFDAVHTMKMEIVDGAITYYIDDVALFGKTFAVPADTAYFFFEMSHAGGYIDNLKVSEYVEPPFAEINLDFSDAANGANYFKNLPDSTNWATTNGTWKSGGSYHATYMTTAIPVNEFKYIAFDWYEPSVENTSAAANFRFGLTADIANRNTTGNSIGAYLWTGKAWLASHVNSTSGWIKNLSAVSLGSVKRIEMLIENEKITLIIGGTTLQSSYAIPFCDQDTSTKEYAYLVLDDAVGAGAYIDNLVVWNKDTYDAYRQEQLDKQYGIEISDKSFVGYDEKKTPNTKDSGVAWGAAYTALKEGATVRRSTYYNMKYDWSGAEYYAFDVVNETDGYVAFGLDVKEGYYAQNGAIADFGVGTLTHGRWWTMGEYMPYYLLYEDGTVKSGVTSRNTLNRGKAVVPTGFKGTLIFPISSFEVLDWSANTAAYDWFTEDANVPALNHILFADVIYCKVTETTGSVTTSNERLLSSDFGAAVSVERTIRAIDQIGVVSAASERLIAFARSNYNALSSENQGLVSNYAKLTAAEAAFYELNDYSYVIGTDGKNFEGTDGVAFGTVFDSAPQTLSAWIKVSRDVADDEHVGTVMGNAERQMSSSVLYDFWNTFSFEITTNGNPKFEWRVSRTNKVVFVVENADVRTGGWMHVAFTRDVDNGLLTCYINGVAVATMQVSAAKIANFTFIKPVMIGSDYTNDKILALSFTPDFHGSIADVRVYSSLLTEEEVVNDAKGKRASGLLGGVDFASGESEEYYDYVNENATDAFAWKQVDNSYFAAEDGEFTFAVIPDTQMIFSRANGYNPGTNIFGEGYDAESNLGFRNMQWLIDNKDLLNLQYVMHVGDLTDNLNYYVASSVDPSKKKWEVEGRIEAMYGFQMLGKLTTAGIPWSLARGNHDGGYSADALAVWENYWQASSAYTKATTDDRLTGEPAKYCYTTRSGNNYIYSYYEKIEINGMKYLVMVLDLEADDNVLAWANEVAAYFTDYKIIVTTHAYMSDRGALLTSLMGSAGVNNSGSAVWEKFASLHSNIELVICGHSSGEDIIRKQMTGVNGNKIWTFMIDSSAHEFTGASQPGLFALLKFSADGKTLTLNHYSMTQGELFGSYNTFTVNLGEQEESEVGGEEELPEAWPEAEDTRQIVLMPNVMPFAVYAAGTGLRNNTAGDSTTMQIAYNGIQFRDNWKAYAVSIDIEKDGVYKFDADAYIKAKTGRIAVLQTCAKDGLTRIVPLTDPDATDSMTFTNGLYGATSSSGASIMMTDILPNGISVSAGDKITIIFTGGTSYWGKMLFDGAVYDGEGNELQDCDLNMTSATIANNLYKAGYNGFMADGTASSYKNYKGFTVGWLHLTGSFANFFTQYTNTVTVNDENGNMLFTAVAVGMGSMMTSQSTLPTLYREGYKFVGYEVNGVMYAGGEYAVKGTSATAGTTQTVVAKFEKLPDGILDMDGNIVIDTSAGFNGALPELSRAGHIFLGYAIDGKLYPAGTVYDKASGSTVVAVFANFSMVNGAAIRLSAPTGMRFQTYLDQAAYAYLTGNVSFGTLIAKADDITVDGALDYSLLTTDAAITKLNILSTKQHTVGDYLYYNGVLAQIKEHHYDWKFAARGYMTVTYADGTTAIFYASVTDNARSVAEVAEKALADVSAVQSKRYDTAVAGGYSVYTTDERTTIEVFIKKEDVVA